MRMRPILVPGFASRVPPRVGRLNDVELRLCSASLKFAHRVGAAGRRARQHSPRTRSAPTRRGGATSISMSGMASRLLVRLTLTNLRRARVGRITSVNRRRRVRYGTSVCPVGQAERAGSARHSRTGDGVALLDEWVRSVPRRVAASCRRPAAPLDAGKLQLPAERQLNDQSRQLGRNAERELGGTRVGRMRIELERYSRDAENP